MSSAATWPPALRTSSRNSARDSSTSSPGASRLGASRPEAWEPGESWRGSGERCARFDSAGEYDSGAEESEGAASTRTVVAFAPFDPARLARERTSRSTATRTARSGLSPDGRRTSKLPGRSAWHARGRDRPLKIATGQKSCPAYTPRVSIEEAPPRGRSQASVAQRSPGIWIAPAQEPRRVRCPMTRQPDGVRYAIRSGC